MRGVPKGGANALPVVSGRHPGHLVVLLALRIERQPRGKRHATDDGPRAPPSVVARAAGPSADSAAAAAGAATARCVAVAAGLGRAASARRAAVAHRAAS